MSTVAYLCRGVVENVGVVIEISLLSHAMQSRDTMYFRFKRGHSVFWLSVDVDDVTVELGMVENMGVAVGISLIICPEK